MNKEEVLRFLIESNGDKDKINEFVKLNNITINEFNTIIDNYIEELETKKIVNPLYLEYKLKHNITKLNRKDIEKIINILNNYINENKYNIKEYILNNNIDYNCFIKFINNYKSYYLKDFELNTIKIFLKRENDFNKDNIDKVLNTLNKIDNDIKGVKKYNILEYFINLGWDTNLLLYFINNNKELINEDLINSLNIYIDKNKLKEEYKLKHNEFIELIKKESPDLSKNKINNIINCFNKYHIPYNIYIFRNLINNMIFKKMVNIE